MKRFSLVLLLLLSSLLVFSPLRAANCVDAPQSVPVTVPQVSFLRAYPFDFSTPVRLAIDAAGAVYIADAQNGEVFVRAADGRVLQRRSGLGRPGAIEVDDAGNIYLADLESGSVAVFNSDWQLINRIATGDIVQPGDMAIDSFNRRLYISDSESHRILVYDLEGQFLFEFGTRGSGSGQFEYPSGVFVDVANNEVLVSDQLGFRVQVFNLEGDYQFCIGGSSASAGGFFQRGRLLSSPQGLWVDDAGRIYVADSFDGQVKVIDRSGRPLARIGAFGDQPGNLRQPSDLVGDAHGRLFIASTNNARLEVFGIDTFSDPEQFAPALMRLPVNSLPQGSTGMFEVHFSVPGHRLSSIRHDSIRINGLPPALVETADINGDAIEEIRVQVDLKVLLETLPPVGPGTIHLQGALNSLVIDARETVEIVVAEQADSDLDGVVDDLDQCPASVAEPVDATGCSLAQHCPCDGFRSHGRYVKCVGRNARQFLRDGLIDKKARRQLVRKAARNDCGKGKGGRPREDDDDSDERDEHEDQDHRDKRDHRKLHKNDDDKPRRSHHRRRHSE